MGTLEIELPDGIEAEIESYIDDHATYLSRSELVRDAVRRLLASDGRPGSRSDVYVNQQQIDRVEANSLEDVKAEQADE